MMLVVPLFHPTRPPTTPPFVAVPRTVTAAELLDTVPRFSPTRPPPKPVVTVTVPAAEALLMLLLAVFLPTRPPPRSVPVIAPETKTWETVPWLKPARPPVYWAPATVTACRPRLLTE